jgi:flagellar basal-body rod protein FlgG
MFDSLYIGATGMQAQQLNVDTIANNLANVATVGYKKSRINFADLVSRDLTKASQVSNLSETQTNLSQASLGAGVASTGVTKVFDAGDLKKTESAFDLAVIGDGFFEVTMPDGSRAFTRGGTFRVNREGLLSTQGGYPLKPGLVIPENTQTLTIGADGHVKVKVAGQSNLVEIGQIELVRFASPTGLIAQGDNLYKSSDNSGEPIGGKAAEAGLGTIAQGFLEGSNVKLVEELIGLVIAQRAYEASVKVVQASDEMLSMVNGLRK